MGGKKDMAKKKSGFLADFKKFIMRGNVLDLAIAVVIGGAFGAIVNSLVSDIIMPLLTLATGDGIQGLSVVLNGEEKYLADGSLNPKAVLWNYGNFLQTIINFLIIALCIFTVLRIVIKVKEAGQKLIKKNGEITEEATSEDVATETAEQAAKAETVEEKTENTEELLREIRDMLGKMCPKDDGKNKE